MKNLKMRLAVLLLSTFCLLAGVYAQITPSSDASTSSLAPTQNYGSNGYLYVHSTTQLTYIQFDLSTIPSGYTGANIAKASLKVYLYSVAGGGTFNVDYVTSPWTEKTITFNDSPTLGGFIAASGNIAAANARDYVIIDITPAVQAWLNGTETNNGIALVGNGTFNAGFESKENTVTSHSPELDIVFTGGGGAITGITTAGGSGLTGGGTSGTLNLSLTNACAANQILEWNGTAWVCAFAGVGTITGVTTQPGLTGGGTAGNVAIGIDNTVVPLLSLENQFTASQSVVGSLTATYLGASGTITAGGGAVFPSTGNSPTSGSPSSPLDLTASSSNGTTASYQTFRWQSANVDGTTPSANLNLLFGAAGATPAPTGFSIAPNGIISFAPNQTFPGGGGGGITNVVAGTGLSGGGSTPTVTLNVNQALVAFQSDLTAGIATAEATAENYASANFLPLTAASSFATLGPNAFTGNQTITGSLFASGNVGIGTTTPQATLDVNGAINAATTFNLSGQPFAWGNNSILSANTAVGFATLSKNTGGDNTAVGYGALNENTSSAYNTAIGSGSLANNTQGGNNTAIGAIALEANMNGSFNTAVGTGALMASTGTLNTGLGYESGPSANGGINNATAIGAYADVEQSNSLVLGSILNTGGCLAQYNCASVNVGIGTTTPQATLDVHGNANITGTLTVGNCNGCGGGGGGSGTVTSVSAGAGLLANPSPITTSGTLSINSAVVPLLANSNTFTGNNTFSGTQTISNGSLNLTGTPGSISATGEISTNGLIFAGSMSTFGTMNAGSYALGGTSVLAHAPSTGGSLLLGENTGNSSLLSSLDISSTTAIGDNTLRFYTGGNYNTALGNSALYEATSGANNTGAGYEALFHNTSGSNNTAMGFNAGNPTGFQNTTGSNNTFLGANSGVGNQLALNYAAAIGSGSVVGQNNAMVLGGPAGSAAAVNVGIGTATPQATLDVEGTAPTVNFGSASNPATFTVNGTLNVTGAVTCGSGCSGGGGGGITSVTGTNGVNAVTSGGAVTLSLNPAYANTFTSTQTVNTSTGNGISATSSSGSASGLAGSNTSTTGSGNGVTGSTSSPLGSGVVGTSGSTSTTAAGYGVYGLANSPLGAGVIGVNNATSTVGGAFGVVGQSVTSSVGTGVYGTGTATGVTGLSYGTGNGVNGLTSAPTGTGVFGNNTATIGGGNGVVGQTTTPTGTGVVGINNVATTGYGVYGTSSNTGVYGTGNGSGVTGATSSPTGSGVVGVNTATSGNAYGVFGQSLSTNGAGVYGTGGNYGVSGYATDAGGNAVRGVAPNAGVGVWGTGNGTSTTGGNQVEFTPVGVWGDTNATGRFGPLASAGVLATADDSVGLYALNNSSQNQSDSPTIYASNLTQQGGYVIFAEGQDSNFCEIETSGGLSCSSAIQGGSTDFKIDDPLDPANKYMYHASVESSEMMDIYSGNVSTDAAGLATVRLPEWFDTVNGDFRYQLTVIGQFAQAIVSSEVANNQFSIKTDKPNVKVSWQITGVRQDAWAKAHPLVVEKEKNSRERGRYISPELYGASAEQSISYHTRPMRAKGDHAGPSTLKAPAPLLK